MNMATVIAVYASLCKELGLPLRFPGSSETYHAIMEMTDAELLTKAMVWAGENDRCDGQAFNITNGDFDRWENLWPRIAQFFKMEYAPPQRLPLTQFMSDKEPVWNSLVKKHNLLNYTFREAAAWAFGEAVFNLGYDVMSEPRGRRFRLHRRPAPRLAPHDDTQRSLKAQATTLVMEFGQLRSMLTAQSVASISRPMLIVVICWLMLIFLSFSLLAPPNPTATVALVASTLSVAGAIFLILEMDLPFEGMIRISSEPMLRAISHLAK